MNWKPIRTAPRTRPLLVASLNDVCWDFYSVLDVPEEKSGLRHKANTFYVTFGELEADLNGAVLPSNPKTQHHWEHHADGREYCRYCGEPKAGAKPECFP